ncbi:MAG: aldo/keto reductase [Candidatus Rokubacteria bacterium]|nr:aldo/keto reductase [Candidatus Rokubacteria bacterium]
MISGVATFAGTERYASRIGGRLPADHFRRLDGGPRTSSMGIGTYLGKEDAATDVQYQKAVTRALERGINVIDTAINYRFQRSERAIGAALEEAIGRGLVARDEIVVATKGGFIPFDGAVPRDAGTFFTETYLKPGIVTPDEVVGGAHCMSPRYLADQIDRSRKNLGLAALDVYYLHNPEMQLEELGADTFFPRLRGAFEALEQAVRDGRIARYGTATWNGYRVDAGTPGHLSLEAVVGVAREAGGAEHHFKVIQAPYNLAMTEAFTRANQRVGGEVVPLVEAARRLGVYVMASASVYQGQLTRNLPPVVAQFLPGLETDGQRAIQFVRSTPGIGTALVGMRLAAHVEENAEVAGVSPLSAGDFARLFTPA